MSLQDKEGALKHRDAPTPGRHPTSCREMKHKGIGATAPVRVKRRWYLQGKVGFSFTVSEKVKGTSNKRLRRRGVYSKRHKKTDFLEM